jgi:hypothetical protein
LPFVPARVTAAARVPSIEQEAEAMRCGLEKEDFEPRQKLIALRLLQGHWCRVVMHVTAMAMRPAPICLQRSSVDSGCAPTLRRSFRQTEGPPFTVPAHVVNRFRDPWLDKPVLFDRASASPCRSLPVGSTLTVASRVLLRHDRRRGFRTLLLRFCCDESVDPALFDDLATV